MAWHENIKMGKISKGRNPRVIVSRKPQIHMGNPIPNRIQGKRKKLLERRYY